MICYNNRMLDRKSKKVIQDSIRRYLPDPSYSAFLFGSRVNGGNRPWSDVDVGIFGPHPIPGSVLEKIRGDLDDSSLPYRVDLVDFKKTSQNFKKVASINTINL